MGVIVGDSDGEMDIVGSADGMSLGPSDGAILGTLLGSWLGAVLGCRFVGIGRTRPLDQNLRWQIFTYDEVIVRHDLGPFDGAAKVAPSIGSASV